MLSKTVTHIWLTIRKLCNVVLKFVIYEIRVIVISIELASLGGNLCAVLNIKMLKNLRFFLCRLLFSQSITFQIILVLFWLTYPPHIN